MTRISMFKPYVNASAIKRVGTVLQSGWIGEGPLVREFEQELSTRLGNHHVVALHSGTSALHLGLLVAGIRHGDEVVTTAQTMLATTTAILAAGGVPVYADVQYGTGNLDPASVRSRITSRTRAILAVDWAGYPCDWEELLSIARPDRLAVIDDAAHALGARYQGRPIGSVAPYTCFSFQAIKHLTTGDGGLLCLPSEEDHRSARQRRWFGIDRQQRQPSILGEAVWNVRELGFKYHMNDIAAAIGLGNLEDVDANLGRRRAIVARYRRELGGIAGISLFDRSPDRESADWLFSIHVRDREEFCRALSARDVESSVVHLRIDRNEVCGGERLDLPELARFTQTHVSLPLHPFLSDDDVGRVIDAVRRGW